ncbi:MAG: photosystem II reaction center protein PsbN [Candidatus Marinimicrobia bacterium]|nr:photosystem II reaction center protein PsbN [Candidatus Neomarinimicrobiota bacterium]
MMIHHYNADPNITFPISIGVIVTIMVLYGIYKGFFDNEGLEDPFDDHDH